MIKKLLPPVNKYYLYISFIIFFLFNLPIINNLPYSDDLHHVFNYSYLRDAPHPLVYWSPWSPYFKSWGLTYSVLWVLNAMFGSDYLFYRIFNLIIHFVNHYLFRIILKKKFKFSDSKNNFYSLFFLFNPLSILTTNWIFQLKTLLAVQFILLILIVLHKSKFKEFKDFLKLYVLFFLSLISKICAILMPFYILYYLIRKFGKRKSLLICAPLFMLSLLYGFLNIKGITYVDIEVKNIKKPIAETIIDPVTPLKNTRGLKKIEKAEKTNSETEVFNEISQSVKIYLPEVLNLESMGDKHIISMQNLGKLVLYTLGLNNNLPFYEDNLKMSSSNWSYFYVLIALAFIYLSIRTKNHFFMLAILLFLPISGYFYVPYMKYSYTSDHWFYPSSFALILGLLHLFKNKRILIFLSLPIFFSYTYTTYKFSNFPQLLIDNYAMNGNKFILENLTQNRSLIKVEDRVKVYDHLLNNIDTNNQTYYKILFQASKETNQGIYIKRHFSRFAADQVRSKDTESLRKFVKNHNGLFPERILYLTNSFSSIYTHTIHKNIRTKALNYLK